MLFLYFIQINNMATCLIKSSTFNCNIKSDIDVFYDLCVNKKYNEAREIFNRNRNINFDKYKSRYILDAVNNNNIKMIKFLLSIEKELEEEIFDHYNIAVMSILNDNTKILEIINNKISDKYDKLLDIACQENKIKSCDYILSKSLIKISEEMMDYLISNKCYDICCVIISHFKFYDDYIFNMLAKFKDDEFKKYIDKTYNDIFGNYLPRIIFNKIKDNKCEDIDKLIKFLNPEEIVVLYKDICYTRYDDIFIRSIMKNYDIKNEYYIFSSLLIDRHNESKIEYYEGWKELENETMELVILKFMEINKLSEIMYIIFYHYSFLIRPSYIPILSPIPLNFLSKCIGLKNNDVLYEYIDEINNAARKITRFIRKFYYRPGGAYYNKILKEI